MTAILWDNQADLAILTEGSQVATLPAENVQNAHLSRRWHTASGVKSTNLVLDLGSSKTCGVFSAVGTNLTAAATFRLRASNSDTTGQTSLVYDSGTVTSHLVTGYGTIYHVFTNVAGRYWRYEPTDTTVPDHLEHGRIVLGPKWTPSIGGVSYGWNTSIEDNSRITQSYGGQTFVNQLPRVRTGNLTLSWMDESEMFTNAFEALRTNGLGRDILVIPQEAASGGNIHRQSIWGLMTQIDGITADSFGVFRSGFSVRERL